tara:strand:- start:652 stop:882 length:231 start_codon:yes stop_codon:yes gene_type:complete
MVRVKITYDIDDSQEPYFARTLLNAAEYRNCLCDLEMQLRNKLKHGDDDWLHDEEACDFLEHLREVIAESRPLQDV